MSQNIKTTDDKIKELSKPKCSKRILETIDWIKNYDSERSYPFPIKDMTNIPLYNLPFGKLYKGKIYISQVYYDCHRLTIIKFYQISLIISLGFSWKKLYHKKDKLQYRHINRYTCKVKDSLSEKNARRFEHSLPKICLKIEKSLLEGRNVYIHCRHGVSRSATVIIYFLIWKYLQTHTYQSKDKLLLETVQYVKRFRKCINPNPRFLQICDELINKTPTSWLKLLFTKIIENRIS